MGLMDFFRRGRPPPEYLDRPFLTVGGETLLTMRQLCNGCLCLGSTGSGKTSGVIRSLLDRVFATPGMGAFLACPKDGDCETWLRLAEKHGRRIDCLVISPRADSHRIDLFGVLSRARADPATRAHLAAGALDAFMEIGTRGQGTDGEGPFWQRQHERLMRNALHLHYLADVPPTAASILAAVTDIASTTEEAKTAEWRSGPLAGLLRKAFSGPLKAEYRAVDAYFMQEMVKLSSRTKSVVTATVTGVLDTLVRGKCAEVLGSSTFDVEAAIEQGKVILVDFPTAVWGDVARFVTVAAAYLVKLAARGRVIHPDTLPFPVVVDECQQFVTEDDFQHAAVSRSSRCPLVMATQGVESLWAIFGGDTGRAKADVLTGNLGTKFVCLPSYQTAKWVSEQIGRERKRFRAGSADNGAYSNPLDLIGFSEATPRITTSWSEQMTEILRPEEMLDLRTGGASRLVDAVVHQPGRVFANGRCFTVATFTQEG